MTYNSATVASSLAELTGVLAGFAFAALTYLMALRDQPADDADINQINRRLTIILQLSFFCLVIAAVLQAIRSGLGSNDDLQVFALTIFIDVTTLLGVLMLFSGLLLMSTALLELEYGLMSLLFDAGGGVGIIFTLVIIRSFWGYAEINTNLWTVVLIVTATGTYFGSARWLVNFFERHVARLWRMLILFIVFNCAIIAIIWSSPTFALPAEVSALFPIALACALAFLAAWLKEIYLTPTGPSRTMREHDLPVEHMRES